MLNQDRNLKRTSLAKGKRGTYKQTNKQQQQHAKTERKEQHIIIALMPTLPDYPGVSRIQNESLGLPYR